MKQILTGIVMCSVAMAGLTACALFEPRPAERSVGRVVDDKVVTSRVKSALATEPVYKFDDVQVTTFNGVVQLSGFVNSVEQKNRAGEVARYVQGVAQVVNNISLKPGAGPPGRTNVYTP